MKECSSKAFIKTFVYSSLLNQINDKSFILSSMDISLAYEILKKEKNFNTGDDIYPSYVMSWIGYIMTYFSCVTGLPQSVLYENMKPEEFYQIYEAYHSLDNEMVIKRIIESKKINVELNDVNVMRKIYNL